MTTTTAQRIKLKQGPIDVWSTREKLALACAVLRSGDQNWYSVSRSLKPFGESRRPSDWFSQKNCALQYSELLENVEQPKRKRGERGESTAQDLIVLELQKKRIDELHELIKKEREENLKIKNEIDTVKAKKADEDFLKAIWERMRKEEKDKEIEEENHKKWLLEREAKMAQLKANRHLLASRSPKSKSTQPPSQPTTPKESESKKAEPLTEVEKALKPDSLSIKIENLANELQESSEKQKNIPPPVSSPSTSPLLTSLLQSPSPSATSSSPYCTNILSPMAIRDMQQRISPSHSNSMTPVSSPSSRHPPTSIPSVQTDSSSFVEPHPPSSRENENSARPEVSSPSHAVASSPTLSKLLEEATPTSVKLHINPAGVAEVQHEEKVVILPQEKEEQIDTIDGSEKTNKDASSNVGDVEMVTIDEESVQLVVESPKKEAPSTIAPQSQVQVETSKKEKLLEPIQPVITVEVKQEKIDAKEAVEDTPVEVQSKVTSPDRVDANETMPSTSIEVKSENASASRPKRKRPGTPATPATPTMTRRSGRVRLTKDRKNSTEEETPSSNKAKTPTSLEPPSTEATLMGAKKLNTAVSAGEIAPLSEESSDNTLLSTSGPATPVATPKPSLGKALSTTDSIPSSPTPVATPSTNEEIENEKGYKMWKKAIMLLWRQAATHKFSNLFHHPVTDSEAKGYSTVVYKPMDLTTIRKKIETGQIRTSVEFQRDMMLMFQNAIMYNRVDHDVHQAAVEMQKEILEGIEDFIETQQKSSPVNDTPTPSTKIRGRRTNVSTSSTDAHDRESSSNSSSRRKRTSTDTEPQPAPPTPSKVKAKKPQPDQPTPAPRPKRVNES